MNNSRTIPFTSAYVDPRAKHEDAVVDGWIGTPSEVELRFDRGHAKGSEIPENYLDIFESDLNELLPKLNGASADDKRKKRNIVIEGQLFYLSISIDINAYTLVLKKIYLRPCAEKKGLFRIILFQIARCSSILNCDMFTECPLTPTVRVLKRAFGSHVEGCHFIEIRELPSDELKPHYNTRTRNPNYLLIRKEILKGMSQKDIAFRLGLVGHCSEYISHSDLILHETFGQAWIKVNRENPIFPSVDIMNYGAPAPTRGIFTVETISSSCHFNLSYEAL
jgi:hypothetical protein